MRRARRLHSGWRALTFQSFVSNARMREAHGSETVDGSDAHGSCVLMASKHSSTPSSPPPLNGALTQHKDVKAHADCPNITRVAGEASLRRLVIDHFGRPESARALRRNEHLRVTRARSARATILATRLGGREVSAARVMRQQGERFGRRHIFLVCKVMSHAKIGDFAAAVSINEDCAKSGEEESDECRGGVPQRARATRRTVLRLEVAVADVMKVRR